MLNRTVAPLIAGLLIICYARPAMSQTTSAARDSIAAAMQAYLEAIRSNDARAVSSWWTDDAVYVPRGAPTIRGRVVLDSILRAFFAAGPVTDVTEQTEEITVDGNWAIQIGTYSESGKPRAGSPWTERGRYVFIWRRQSDGGWKIARAMATDLPPQAPRN